MVFYSGRYVSVYVDLLSACQNKNCMYLFTDIYIEARKKERERRIDNILEREENLFN